MHEQPPVKMPPKSKLLAKLSAVGGIFSRLFTILALLLIILIGVTWVFLGIISPALLTLLIMKW